MSRETLTTLAAVTLLLTIWMIQVLSEPGVQIWAGVGAGAAALATAHLIVAAARAENRSPK